MNSAPYLLTEDRPDFERVLDEALRATEQRNPGLNTTGQRLSTHQLRTMALNASTAISACAATEYDRYVQARKSLGTPLPPPRPEGSEGTPPGGTVSPGEPGGDGTDGSGAGLVAVLAVLAPVLAGAAAAIFLIVGYVLRVFAPDASVGQPLVTAGWVFAACAAISALIAGAGLLVTALRNGGGRRARTRAAEVDRAREKWQRALLERGMVPFLSEAMANGEAPTGPEHGGGAAGPAPSADHRPPRATAPSRTPHLGYSRPGFTSPGDGGSDPAPGPRYSSPDFTSPDFGGRDHRPS
ncbi:hypothetical protein OYE22_16350 [Streptomyces sp. 71268]|uniref:hypothetical protein n=1 Tax=Streptomyces sp. 71268 TaxID=3002640 RepID=UPI0023F7C856|nr:hypothetical protein [Streptomyces sp. 71268]WEV26590.1 hypothetical protein OYE22_16350 [Streptomyces sp. 71268]